MLINSSDLSAKQKTVLYKVPVQNQTNFAHHYDLDTKNVTRGPGQAAPKARCSCYELAVSSTTRGPW